MALAICPDELSRFRIAGCHQAEIGHLHAKKIGVRRMIGNLDCGAELGLEVLAVGLCVGGIRVEPQRGANFVPYAIRRGCCFSIIRIRSGNVGA